MSRARRQQTLRFLDPQTAIVANLLILACLACVAILQAVDPDLYYSSLQEDEFLEWMTFWAFAIAALAAFVTAMRQRRNGQALPWFSVGVGLLCAFVALEEISWGQRLIGYRPPVYFLKHNFQQELNLHNVFSNDARAFVLQAVILGYGVVLPLLAASASIARRMKALAVVAPDPRLIPAFLATAVLYTWYPWRFTGETVELMLGLGFLFAGVVVAAECGAKPEVSVSRARPAAVILGSWVLVVGLGVANTTLARIGRAASPEYIELAQVESETLRRDFLAMALANNGVPATRCNLHKRVYSYERKYEQPYLYKGGYASLVGEGMPEERAAFFLDPWNSPYWIRDRCESGDTNARVIFVYSFGPNRRRDSNYWEIRGDDIGAYIYR